MLKLKKLKINLKDYQHMYTVKSLKNIFMFYKNYLFFLIVIIAFLVIAIVVVVVVIIKKKKKS